MRVGRKALMTFKSMPEHDRFVRGMFSWMGFKAHSGDEGSPALSRLQRRISRRG